MSEEKEYLTKEKYKELTVELEHLKTVKRKEIAENLEFAKALGDLSENAEYHEAREEQAAVEDRIAKIETMLKSAEIMHHHHGGTTTVGSTVVVQKYGQKEKVRVEIVGSEEANVREHKISFKSPMGSALIGKKKGDDFTVTAPKGEIKYKILDVE
jgi:transcription elongation factor GreA